MPPTTLTRASPPSSRSGRPPGRAADRSDARGARRSRVERPRARPSLPGVRPRPAVRDLPPHRSRGRGRDPTSSSSRGCSVSSTRPRTPCSSRSTPSWSTTGPVPPSATASVPSTRAAFDSRCESDWWPALRARHPIGSGGNDLDELLITMLHHRHRAADDIVAAYPSHLHIDLLPEAQGEGLGRALMETMQDASAPPGRPVSTSVSAPATSGPSRSTPTSATRPWSSDAVGSTLGLRL